MRNGRPTQRIEFGDYQTPDELAANICKTLKERGVKPATIIEPTCGVGSFIKAAAAGFPDAAKIIGVDINPSHIFQAKLRLANAEGNKSIELIYARISLRWIGTRFWVIYRRRFW
jgi:ubiquinone/menaquinone biosynthesis C-methylase UbiE